MKFSIEKESLYTIFKLEEEKLDSTLSPELKSELVALQTQGVNNLILNLSSTKYADSSGLSALLTGNRAYTENGGAFILSEVTAFVDKLLTISQLNNVLTVLASDEAAKDLILANSPEEDEEE
ncbi:MAG: STAS domain-containing protein [Cytophagia bacterium]|nr:STAS domain-containing protein [Cytophagia bacterium]